MGFPSPLTLLPPGGAGEDRRSCRVSQDRSPLAWTRGAIPSPPRPETAPGAFPVPGCLPKCLTSARSRPSRAGSLGEMPPNSPHLPRAGFSFRGSGSQESSPWAALLPISHESSPIPLPPSALPVSQNGSPCRDCPTSSHPLPIRLTFPAFDATAEGERFWEKPSARDVISCFISLLHESAPCSGERIWEAWSVATPGRPATAVRIRG